MWLNSKEAEEDMVPRQEESKHNEIFCTTMSIDPKNGTTYMDCTGKFPVKSLDGMATMFIMYDWSSNAILSRPIPNTKDETIIGKYKETIDYLTKRGFKPRFNILDNIASKAIVTYLKEECKIGIQLVEPHNHRANPAERAIRTFKSHFIAGLCTYHSNFPLVLWSQLVPQAQDTLNMLRRSRTHPKLLAYHVLEGVHDYNKVPFAPPGTPATIFNPPEIKNSLEPRALDTWYVGPAWYRCWKFFIQSTGRYRI